MNAAEALNMSLNALSSIVVSEQINITNNKIKEAAENGKFYIINSFIGTQLSNDAIHTLVRHYENEGYKVRHHYDQELGCPSSSDYYILSW